MKKSLYFLAAAGLMMVACDPIEDDSTFKSTTVAEGELLKGAKFQQFEDANCTIPSETGNYIAFSIPGVSAVNIYVIKKDGSEKLLKTGISGGVIYYLPSRGSDLEQTLIFEYTNLDGTVVRETKTLTVVAATALSPEVALLAGYNEKKTWRWDTSMGAFWGNMGYCGGDGTLVGTNSEGQWWGVTNTEEFMGQKDHAGGSNPGDDNVNARMEIADDMSITSYSESGEEIRKGPFAVELTKNSKGDAWRMGLLKTTSILYPYEINAGGNIPGEYEIVYLTAEKMTLVYPDGGNYDGLGGWGEATFWHFAARDPQVLAAGTSVEGKKWAWNNECPGGAVWGNMGYCGGNGSEVYTAGAGKWWGVTSTEEFAGQQDHRGGDAITGDDDIEGAYMIWTEKEVFSYNAKGEVIRNGEYTFVPVEGNDWKVADLKINSSNGAILWPYEINSHGKMPSVYDVVYLSDDAMTLVYPDGGAFDALGGWGEASFWQFKAVK